MVVAALANCSLIVIGGRVGQSRVALLDTRVRSTASWKPASGAWDAEMLGSLSMVRSMKGCW